MRFASEILQLYSYILYLNCLPLSADYYYHLHMLLYGVTLNVPIETSSGNRGILRHFLKIALALAPPRASPSPSPAVGVALVLA